MYTKLVKEKTINNYGVYLVFYSLCFVIVSINHEPWFDEAQAWQIAKCSSITEFIEIMHYEGHPPLWYLVLLIPIKLGLSYEIGLKSIGYLLWIILIYIILKDSPYPKIVKLLLPLNYFVFYQNGIIVRPYVLMYLILLLIAKNYKERNNKPFKYIGLLSALCMLHAYGIMISFGLAVLYTIEIITDSGQRIQIRHLIENKKVHALCMLLMIAIVIVIMIFPQEDTLAMSVQVKNPFYLRLICTLFTIIPECFIYRSDWFYYDRLLLKNANITLFPLLVGIIVGLFFYLAIYLISSRKSFCLFLLTYIPYAFFAAATYMTGHHVGVGLGIVMLWLWVTLTDENRFENWENIKNLVVIKQKKLMRIGIYFIAGLCLGVPIYWTIYSSVGDIKNEYSYGRSVSQFLNKTGLINSNIYAAWDSYMLDTDNNAITDQFVTADPTILAYFDKNIYKNVGTDGKLYKQHKIPTTEDINKIAEEWEKEPIPDTIIGKTQLESIYGDKISLNDYTLVFVSKVYGYYKDGNYAQSLPIYVRSDLLDKYSLMKIDYNFGLPVFEQISEEMKIAYKEGEISIEEIVDMTIGEYGKRKK